ncbi:MAG: beta-ketoacyl-[acyl-carrier-protein] synthase II, partial [Polyangiaceae bacterium]|nr:beta-ketoacyl-[acyl-carrier-protein] synthase II [Polyangiaceae bacterium]
MSVLVERVFVTGVGVVSSIGLGRSAFFRALEQGLSGISPVQAFETAALGRHVAGEVKGFDARDHLGGAERRRMGRCAAMAVAAARMAVEDAGLGAADIPGERTAIVLGTTMGEARILADLSRQWIHGGPRSLTRALIPRYGSTLLPVHVARAVGARGLTLTLPAACAAGNYAIGIAADLIRAGRADLVVTGAAELLQELQFSGFVRLAAMAPERCQPFDANRLGLLLGEGAGILILESEAHARRRGARFDAEIGGYGLSCDAYHITRPHPDATGS